MGVNLGTPGSECQWPVGSNGLLKRNVIVINRFLTSFVVVLSSTIAPNVIKAPAAAASIITIERTVVIHRTPADVFDVAAELLNDPYWREEVNTMTADGPFGVGTIYTEDAHVGLQLHWITDTELTVVDPPREVMGETPPSSPYFLRFHRSFEPWGLFSTKMTYEVQFSRALAEAVFGVGLPDDLVESSYGLRMTEYLATLKVLLELGLVD